MEEGAEIFAQRLDRLAPHGLSRVVLPETGEALAVLQRARRHVAGVAERWVAVGALDRDLPSWWRGSVSGPGPSCRTRRQSAKGGMAAAFPRAAATASARARRDMPGM